MKERFLNAARTHIKREGIEDLISYLESTDFFEAPASTKYHGAYKGGLVEHSLNVFGMLANIKSYVREDYSLETLAICGLFHDICKANMYKVEMRNAKNQNGEWIKVPFYTVDEKFPYGHGEKSVYLINKFMHLTDEEALAIRWHMGGFTDSVIGGSYALTGAYKQSVLALELHVADMRATYVLEK